MVHMTRLNLRGLLHDHFVGLSFSALGGGSQSNLGTDSNVEHRDASHFVLLHLNAAGESQMADRWMTALSPFLNSFYKEPLSLHAD